MQSNKIHMRNVAKPMRCLVNLHSVWKARAAVLSFLADRRNAAPYCSLLNEDGYVLGEALLFVENQRRPTALRWLLNSLMYGRRVWGEIDPGFYNICVWLEKGRTELTGIYSRVLQYLVWIHLVYWAFICKALRVQYDDALDTMRSYGLSERVHKIKILTSCVHTIQLYFNIHRALINMTY